MRIDEFIDAALRRSVLKRVRVRVDPRESSVNLHMSSSYEGYILQEQDTTVTVYFINTPAGVEPVQQVQKQHVTQIKDTDSSLINKVCKVIIGKGIKPNNPVLQQIRNVNNAEFLDSYLRQLGFDDKQLVDIYKKACTLNEQTVGLPTRIAQALTSPTAKSVIDVATKTTGVVADLPKLIVGRNSIFRRMAKFLKSFDINDLIFINKNIPANAGVLKKPQKGRLIYITGLENFELLKDPDQNYYNLIGQFADETLDENKLHYNFSIIEPVQFRNKYGTCYADFPLFKNEKTGYINLQEIRRHKVSHTVKTTLKCYKAKFNDFKNHKLAQIVNEVSECPTESLGQIENKNINAYVKTLTTDNIINEKKLSKDNLNYLILVGAFAQINEKLKNQITDIIVALSDKTDFKELDDNNKTQRLRQELEEQGIKINVRLT